MALPVLISVGAAASGVGDITPAPGAHIAGDLLLTFVETNGGQAAAIAAGYTEVPGSPVVVGTPTRLTVMYKFAASGAEPGPTITDPGDHVYGVTIAIRGVHSSDPFEAIASMSHSSSVTSISLPGLLTKRADCLVVNALSTGLDTLLANASAEANATLANLTERHDGATDSAGGGGLVIYTGEKAVAGVVGPTTLTSTNTNFAALTIALRPADPVPSFTLDGTVTIDGAPAPNGTAIEIWDRIDGVLETTTTVAGGAGGYTAAVKYNTAARYRVVADTGTKYGASPLSAAA